MRQTLLSEGEDEEEIHYSSTASHTNTRTRCSIGPRYFPISITGRKLGGLRASVSNRRRLPPLSITQVVHVDTHCSCARTYARAAFIWRRRSSGTAVAEEDGGPED